MTKPTRYLLEILTFNRLRKLYGSFEPWLVIVDVDGEPLYIWSEEGRRPLFNDEDQFSGYEPCTYWSIAQRGSLLYRSDDEKAPEVRYWNEQQTTLYNPNFVPRVIVWDKPAVTSHAAPASQVG